jgi:hypothetical protein
VHPSKVLTTSTGIASSFSSQEPRRPRFSFFYLHNVKELTFTPHWQNVGEAVASDLFKQNKLLSGCPAASLPCQKCANQWEQLQVVRVVSAAVSKLVRPTCQPLFFDFLFGSLSSPRRISKPRPSQISLSFQWFAAVRFAGWRLALQR